MELYIFDFDDTLAITDSRVLVKRNGQDIWMTSREFAEFEFNTATDELDFGDFGRAQGTLIKDTVQELENAMNDGADVFIVTARSIAQPVEDWLMSELGYSPQIVATAGSAGKKPWLLNHLKNNDYERIIVYEDCRHNIRSLKDATAEHNSSTGANIQYSAMCILPDESIVQIEQRRWQSENILSEDSFRDIIKKFLKLGW